MNHAEKVVMVLASKCRVPSTPTPERPYHDPGSPAWVFEHAPQMIEHLIEILPEIKDREIATLRLLDLVGHDWIFWEQSNNINDEIRRADLPFLLYCGALIMQSIKNGTQEETLSYLQQGHSLAEINRDLAAFVPDAERYLAKNGLQLCCLQGKDQ